MPGRSSPARICSTATSPAASKAAPASSSNLAAGLDTRPYRMDLPPSLRWIEVDLPDILDYKEDGARRREAGVRGRAGAARSVEP